MKRSKAKTILVLSHVRELQTVYLKWDQPKAARDRLRIRWYQMTNWPKSNKQCHYAKFMNTILLTLKVSGQYVGLLNLPESLQLCAQRQWESIKYASCAALLCKHTPTFARSPKSTPHCVHCDNIMFRKTMTQKHQTSLPTCCVQVHWNKKKRAAIKSTLWIFTGRISEHLAVQIDEQEM